MRMPDTVDQMVIAIRCAAVVDGNQRSTIEIRNCVGMRAQGIVKIRSASGARSVERLASEFDPAVGHGHNTNSSPLGHELLAVLDCLFAASDDQDIDVARDPVPECVVGPAKKGVGGVRYRRRTSVMGLRRRYPCGVASDDKFMDQRLENHIPPAPSTDRSGPGD